MIYSRNQCNTEVENDQTHSDAKYVPMDPFGMNSSCEILTESAHSNISREENGTSKMFRYFHFVVGDAQILKLFMPCSDVIS